MQVPTSASRAAAFPSHLHCHLLPVQGEPEGNPELFPITPGSPPWGPAKHQRRKEANIHTLILNSCQATEQILRFVTPMNQHRALKTKLWQVLDSAEILPLTELGPEWLSVPGLATAVSLSILPAPLQMPPDGLSRIFCGWINENSGPQGAKCTQRPMGAAAVMAELSTRVSQPEPQQNFLCQTRKMKFCLSSAVPSSLPRMVCALRTNDCVMNGWGEPFLPSFSNANVTGWPCCWISWVPVWKNGV